MNRVIRSNQLTVFLLLAFLLLLGLLIGGTHKTLMLIDVMKHENTSYISSKISNELNNRFKETLSQKRILYKATYVNMDTGTRQTIFFRTYENPFKRFKEIVEQDSIRYNSLKIEESSLLDKE
jgi:hypothetical protein